MPADILVAVPVLDRPARAEPFYASLAESLLVAEAVDVRLMFLTSPGDLAEIRALADVELRNLAFEVEHVPWPAGPGDWARKLNYAIAHTSEPLILLGADDLDFHAGWAGAVMRSSRTTGAGVIGTNDLHNPRVVRGTHSTHPVISRAYALEGAIDGGPVLHEGYGHQFVDDELVGTARKRRAWTFCDSALVEHLHPYFGGAAWDSTYKRGQATTAADAALFRQRKRLWA